MDESEEYKWVLWIGSEPMYGNDWRYMLKQAEAHGLDLRSIMSTSAGMQED